MIEKISISDEDLRKLLQVSGELKRDRSYLYDFQNANLNTIYYRGEIGRVVLTVAFQSVGVSGRIFPAGPGSF